MKLKNAVLSATLSIACIAQTALAQTASSDTKPAPEAFQYETYRLANVSQQNEMNEVVTALRNMVNPRTRLFLVPSENAILMEGAPDQLTLAKKLLGDLDRPRKTYRLTYTVRDMDADKQVGIQHFSLIVVAGARTTLKNGSRVPILVEIPNPNANGNNPGYTYIDIGLNIDASLDECTSGVRLRTHIERSSVIEEKSVANTQNPVIRQATLEGTSILTQGKPVVLGSLDIPGSTRHTEIEVSLAVVP